MPGLPYRELPAQDILQQNLKQQKDYLNQQYKTQWQGLRQMGLSSEQFKAKVNQLQTDSTLKWNKIKAEHGQQIASVNRLRNFVSRGVISHETSQKAEKKLLGIPTGSGAGDWRAEHGRVIAEINRIDSLLNQVDASTEKFRYPRKDVKWGWGKQMEYDTSKLTSEEKTELSQLLSIKDNLLLQEQQLLDVASSIDRKSTMLQSAQRRKQGAQREGFGLTSGLPTGVPPGIMSKGQAKTFQGQIGASIPKPKTKRLDARTAQEIYFEAGRDANKAREIARQRGYTY